MTDPVMQQIIETVGAIVIALIGLGVTYATIWIRQKTKNEKLANAADEIGKAVMVAVKEAEQTIRPTLADGKLTPKEVKGIKRTVVNNIKARVTPAALKIAESNLKDFNKYLDGEIEAAAYDIKSTGNGGIK